MARVARRIETKTLEQKLWDAADALRGNQEPSEYKHVVLGLVFLKYISDRFEGRRKEIDIELIAEGSSPSRWSASSRTATSTPALRVLGPRCRALGSYPEVR